jgi:DedD protein
MAKAINDEEVQLKKRARRRLVGAIALVLLIVVFLPMILDSEPKPLNQDIAIDIPPIPKPESTPPNSASDTVAPAMPITPATPPHVAGLPEAAPEAPSAATPAEDNSGSTKSEQARSQPKPVSKPAQKQEAKSVVATQSHASGDESFVVQLGAFSNAANAKALQKKLQENKFKAYTEIVRNAGAERTRVRVGPYPSREAAEKARNRLMAKKLVIGDAAVVRRD